MRRQLSWIDPRWCGERGACGQKRQDERKNDKGGNEAAADCQGGERAKAKDTEMLGHHEAAKTNDTG